VVNGAVISLVVLGLVVVLFVANRLPVEVVAIGSALVLWATGVIDLDQAATGAHDGVHRGRGLVPHARGDARQHGGDGPAGYRFGDYWKLGLPMVGVFFVVAIGLVPLVWPL
jgi:di/tricarboxylate transporter